MTKGSDGSRWFEVLDPEGNKIEFVQPAANAKAPDDPNVIGHHIIHVGFPGAQIARRKTSSIATCLASSLTGMAAWKDDKVDWVSQQVPDGHDWLEYMLTSGPSGSGIPANISQQSLGVLDHFSIGENSVPDAYKMLEGRQPARTGRHDEAPKIGKDGKWQFNMYDPDGIRLELMNFHATEKPCCSPFTAQDPAE